MDLVKQPYNMERLKEILMSGEALVNAFAAFFVAFFAPVWLFLCGMLSMVIFDQILGRMTAIKRGEVLSQAGKIRTLDKFKIYAIGILGAAIIDYLFFSIIPGVGLVGHPFTIWVSFQIIWSEYQSVFRNITELTKTKINLKDVGNNVIERLMPGSSKSEDKKDEDEK